MDFSPPGSSVHGILQARILEWVAISSSTWSSWPRHQTCVFYVSCIGRWVLYHQRHLGSPSGSVTETQILLFKSSCRNGMRYCLKSADCIKMPYAILLWVCFGTTLLDYFVLLSNCMGWHFHYYAFHFNKRLRQLTDSGNLESGKTEMLVLLVL